MHTKEFIRMWGQQAKIAQGNVIKSNKVRVSPLDM
jgi:hypothetical protein